MIYEIIGTPVFDVTLSLSHLKYATTSSFHILLNPQYSERHGRVVNAPASYSGNPWQKVPGSNLDPETGYPD
jgi:hypothetical protein